MCKRIYAIQIIDKTKEKALVALYNDLRKRRQALKKEYLTEIYLSLAKQPKPGHGGSGDGDSAPWTWSKQEVEDAISKLSGQDPGSNESITRICSVIGEKISKKYSQPGPDDTENFRKNYVKSLQHSQITLELVEDLLRRSADFELRKLDDSAWAVASKTTSRQICILHCGPSAFYVPRLIELDAVHDPESAFEVDAKLVSYEDYKYNIFAPLPAKPEPPPPGDRPLICKHGHPARHYVLDDLGVPTRRYVYVVKSKFQIETLCKKGKVVGRHAGKIVQLIEMAAKLLEEVKDLDERCRKVLEVFLSQPEENLGKTLFQQFYGLASYHPEFCRATPVDIFSVTELKDYSTFLKALDGHQQFYEDNPRLARLAKDLLLVYIHQYQGSGARQRGNAVAQTLTPLLSNTELPFGADGALVFRVDLAQVPVPRVDQPPNVVNFFSKLYGTSLAERLQATNKKVKYDINWSTAKNREVFLRELKTEWIVDFAEPLALEMKGEDGAFLCIDSLEQVKDLLMLDLKRTRIWKDFRKFS